MIEKIRTVRLYGRLRRFGHIHRLAVNSTAEAIRAMCVVIPGFEKEIAGNQDLGVAYACFAGKRNLSEDELQQPVGDEDIRIAPVLTGAKVGGLFQTILGAALIAAAFYAPVFGFAALGTTGAVAAPALLSMGVALALGGVVQMLSPQQRGLSAKDSPDNGASYNFNGPVNTTAQGNPVPLLYGEMIVGSAVVSAGVFAEDQV